jgi:hypothetical protein
MNVATELYALPLIHKSQEADYHNAGFHGFTHSLQVYSEMVRYNTRFVPCGWRTDCGMLLLGSNKVFLVSLCLCYEDAHKSEETVRLVIRSENLYFSLEHYAFLAIRFFRPLSSKYSFHHPVLIHSFPVLTLWRETNFHKPTKQQEDTGRQIFNHRHVTFPFLLVLGASFSHLFRI